MDKRKKFSNTFKEFIQLVPLKQRSQLYIGLKSKLEISINEYIEEKTFATVTEKLVIHEKEQGLLKERILYLELLLDAAGIKHKLTSEDVYPKTSHNRD